MAANVAEIHGFHGGAQAAAIKIQKGGYESRKLGQAQQETIQQGAVSAEPHGEIHGAQARGREMPPHQPVRLTDTCD